MGQQGLQPSLSGAQACLVVSSAEAGVLPGEGETLGLWVQQEGRSPVLTALQLAKDLGDSSVGDSLFTSLIMHYYAPSTVLGAEHYITGGNIKVAPLDGHH